MNRLLYKVFMLTFCTKANIFAKSICSKSIMVPLQIREKPLLKDHKINPIPGKVGPLWPDGHKQPLHFQNKNKDHQNS